MVFGKELILDLKDCKGEINNKDYLQLFVNELLDKIKMKKIGKTIFSYFEPTEFNIKNDLVGFTVLQILSLSSLSIHICDISRTMYINIFTCGDLIEETVIEIIHKYFQPIIINKQIIIRGTNVN